MLYRDYLTMLGARTGLDADLAALAAETVLGVLGQRMAKVGRDRVIARMPPELGCFLARRGTGATFDLDDFFARVALAEWQRVGFAVEHARAVCEVLAEQVQPRLLRSIREALPSAYADLFQVYPRRALEHPVPPPPAFRHNLASGVPGPGHPLSEARPNEGHRTVVEDDPHGENHLSGGRADSRHPVSDAH